MMHRILSVLAIGLMVSACSDDASTDPAPHNATGTGKGNGNGTGTGTGEGEEPAPTPPTITETDLGIGNDFEELDHAAKTPEEWDAIEGPFDGGELDGLYGPNAASAEGVRPQGFIGSIGKVFKGVSFSIGSIPKAGFLKVGSFLPKGDVFSGALFVDANLPFGMDKLLAGLTQSLVTGIQKQGALAAIGKLGTVSPQLGEAYAKLFGGKAADFKISTPSVFNLGGGKLLSNKFVLTTSPAPKVLGQTTVLTGGPKPQVTNIPKALGKP